MIKSRAKRFLESLREEDGASLDQQSDQQAMSQLPDDKDAKAAGAQPDEPVGDVAAAIAAMKDPEQMAEALDAMDGQMDKYMDENDDDVFTPQDDDQKECLTEARSYMREASAKLKGMKRY